MMMMMMMMMIVFQGSHSITNPLLLVCGRYNSKLFPTLSCSIISKLSSLPEPSPDLFKLRTRSVGFQDQSDEDSVGRMEVLLEVACRWKKVPEILDLIGEWVLPALDEPQPRRVSELNVAGNPSYKFVQVGRTGHIPVVMALRS